ncbi:hypothetical protein Z948_2124 [Sulfitobacter donghicola DSW-25 = KCTC 12864 = JCM 14565]|nr:hypothetical protein Z948_2124 [Sulfitobacter donghicola DSW-25 = KCTC 12864 = JCM 14565]
MPIAEPIASTIAIVPVCFIFFSNLGLRVSILLVMQTLQTVQGIKT